MTTKHISLPSIFSDGDPTEWFKRYEICCRANDWDDDLKVKKLPTLLEGEALVTWLELTTEQQLDYKVAKAKILEGMGPVRFVSMDDFHRRRLLPGESLSVFSHELKRLIDQAMPTADAATRQQLLIHQFLSGLPTEVSKRLRAAGEVDDLEKLIQRAKLLMTIDAKEKPEEKSVAAVQQPISQVEAITKQVAAALTNGMPASQPDSQYVFAAINRVMYSVTVQGQKGATRVEELATSPKIADRETDKGRPVWAGNAPENSEPSM